MMALLKIGHPLCRSQAPERLAVRNVVAGKERGNLRLLSWSLCAFKISLTLLGGKFIIRCSQPLSHREARKSKE
jgi:hypothetical protein